MSLLTRLFILFVGVPLLELFILVQVGQWLGLWPTLALVVVTGACGAALARLEGLRTLWRIRAELNQGHLPAEALFDGFAVLFGGMLLLTPGILTDMLGLAFLLPPTRFVLLRRIRASLERRLMSGAIHVTHISGFPSAGSTAWDSAETADRAGGFPRGEIVVEAQETRDR